MPLEPNEYQKVLQRDHFQQMRLVADPAADAVIKQSVETEGTMGSKELFDLLISNIRLPVAQLPASIQGFIKYNQTLPEWAEAEKIQLAHDLFRDHGPKFLIFLYYKSLPILYSCKNGAQVLVRTGRLAHNSQSIETFSRRIAETGQFLIDVMTKGGMKPGGIGVDSALRVRLIHAAIRHFIPTDQWDEQQLGKPINQSDMVLTLMTFSVAILDALDTFNIEESRERKEAYFHLWKVVGYLMGIQPDLLPPNMEEGRKYLDFALEQESRTSEAGILLTRALTRFADERLKVELLRDLPEALIRLLAGKDIARKLGIQNPGCLGMALPSFLAKIFGWGEKLEDRFPQIRSVFDELSFVMSQKMVQYFNKEKNVHFRIPGDLKKHWNLD